VGNRSRKERRTAQARRAADAQDPGWFRDLASRSPESAAAQLGLALSRLSPESPSPLDTIAEDLCGQLRRGGKLESARALAATAPRSRRLRLEHALAAFALGKDDEAERAAEADPAVKAAVAPLVAAARAVGAGEADGAPEPAEPGAHEGAARPPANGAARGRKRAASAPPSAADALHAAAGAVQAVALGKARAARDLAAKMNGGGPAVGAFAADMRDAIDLELASSPARADAPAARLARSRHVSTDARVRGALVAALARLDASLAAQVGLLIGMSSEELRPLRALAPPDGGADGRSEVHAAMEIASVAGASAFAPEHRAAAALYEGFGCLSSDPKRAERAFDRAVELGADLLEALRGKMLAAMDVPADALGDAPELPPRMAAAAADRFARAARRTPLAAPFARLASVLAAQGWEAEGDTRAALASIEVARAIPSSEPDDEIDLLEASVRSVESPARAAALLDALLARDPRNVQAWRDRIELEAEIADDRRADDLVLRAAAATQDPELQAAARSVRLERGEVAPFEGLVPGAVTPGALATEAATFLCRPGTALPLPETAAACRAALEPKGQLAFDVAVYVVLVQEHKVEEATRALHAAIDAWWDAPPMLAKLAATAWAVGLQAQLVPAARRLASRPGAGAALAALFEAAVAAGDPQVAKGLLHIGAALWDRKEIQRRRSRIPKHHLVGLGDLPGAPRGADPSLSTARVQREIEATLAPEFLFDHGGGELPDGDLDLLDDPNGDLDLDDLQIEGLLAALGISTRELERASPAKLDRIQQALLRFTSQPVTPRHLDQLSAELRRILGGA
jgi:hypothetical protein